MNTITFPALNLKFNISNIAISLFGINIYWYGVIIISAICISLLLCKKDDGKYGISFETIIEWFLWVLPISIIGARIYYVVFNINQYNGIQDVLDFRSGGLAIYGALIFGVLTTIVFCKIKKIKFLDILDYVIPYLALSQAIGRWGNFVNAEAYGTETKALLRMGIYENEIYKEVHPAFLYESFVLIIIFVVLNRLKLKRKYSGQITYIYLFLYGLIRMFIEQIRSDSLMLYNLKISQVVSLVIFVISGMILSNRKLKCRKTEKNIETKR